MNKSPGFSYFVLSPTLIVVNSKSAAELQAILIQYHLTSLGFQINMKKSILHASNQMKFLGNIINSTTMIVSIPYSKCQKIIQDFKAIIKSSTFSIRKLAAISGAISSTFDSIEGYLIHQRYLQANIATYIQKHANWNQKVFSTNYTKKEAILLMEIIKLNHGTNIS